MILFSTVHGTIFNVIFQLRKMIFSLHFCSSSAAPAQPLPISVIFPAMFCLYNIYLSCSDHVLPFCSSLQSVPIRLVYCSFYFRLYLHVKMTCGSSAKQAAAGFLHNYFGLFFIFHLTFLLFSVEKKFSKGKYSIQ